MNNDIYIVTGATGSIGKAIATSLAGEGRHIVLACRNMNKAETLRSELLKTFPKAVIYKETLCLNSFKSVRTFATKIMDMGCKVTLINNAGVMTRYNNITSDGYEEDYQVNFISTALLSHLLIPVLKEVVFTVSVTRNWCKIPQEFPTENHFSQLGTYSRSKRALATYAVYLAEDLKDKGIKVNCADPGIVDTGMITMHRWFDPISNILFRPFISSPQKGASSALNALKSDISGYCFHHNKKLPMNKGLDLNDCERLANIVQALGISSNDDAL